MQSPVLAALPLLRWTCPWGHRPFPASVSSQMGKAKPTLPGEIETNTRDANIIYLVYKWQYWSVLASEKNREKPKGRKVIREIVCWSPRSSLSSWRSWDSSNMTWGWVIAFQCPQCSLASHFPVSRAFLTVGDFFLRTILEEKMLQSFSYSSHLGSKQHCREVAHSIHCAAPPCLCLHFYSFYFIYYFYFGATPKGCSWEGAALAKSHQWYQTPTVSLGAGVFLVFPMASAKAAELDTRQADWASVWERSSWQWAPGGCASCDRQGETCAGSQGAVTLGPMKAALFPSRSCCLSSLWLEVAPCCDGGSFVLLLGCLHPLAVMPSVPHGLWATDHPSWLQEPQITPPLCWRGAIVFRAGKSPSSNKL